MALSSADMEKLRLGLQNRCRPVVRGITFEFRPLTIGEINDITTQSVAKFEKMLPAEKHSIKESTLYTILTLCKASEVQLGVPGVTEDTLNLLTADELGYMMREYRTMTDLCNPVLETIPEADLIRLADEVKKNQSAAIELSGLQLLRLVQFLSTRQTSPTE